MKKQTFEDNLKRMPDAEIHAKMEVVCTEHFFPPEFFEKHPDSNMVIDMFCLGVHGNYRKRGIGGHLLDEAMKVWIYFWLHLRALSVTNHISRLAKRLVAIMRWSWRRASTPPTSPKSSAWTWCTLQTGATTKTPKIRASTFSRTKSTLPKWHRTSNALSRLRNLESSLSFCIFLRLLNITNHSLRDHFTIFIWRPCAWLGERWTSPHASS